MNKYTMLILLLATVTPVITFAQHDSIKLSEKSSLRTTGYFRSSIGESLGGGTMAEFKTPGASATYRLGNEPNTFGEFGVIYTHELNDGTSLEIVGQLTGYAPFDSGQDFKLDNLGQFYAKMNNILGQADLWAGKRFYNRSDIHLLNYVWYNVAQESNFGFGVEDINVFNQKGKLAISAYEFENKNVQDLIPKTSEEQSIATGNLKSYILDARLTDLLVNENGTLNFWGRLSTRKANSSIHYEATNGFAIGAWHQQNNLWNGKASNQVQTSFKKGNTINQYNYAGLPVFETYGDPEMRNYDLKKNYTFEISNNFLYEDEKKFAFNFITLYRVDHHGIQPYNMITGEKVSVGENVKWFTAGFRYMKFLHKHFNLALEAGTDYIDNQTIHQHGWMQKITFAPQFSWNYGFYSRPVLRPFVTFANWSESLKGSIGNGPGNAPFGDKTNGLTYGVSFEIWW